jgi:hypothetical protein
VAFKISLGSLLLTKTFEQRGGKAELARRMGSRQELVARWATGARVPPEVDQSWMEDNAHIPARTWGDPPLKPADLIVWIAENEWTPVKLTKEAAAEPAGTFPSTRATANRGGHAA